MYTKIKRVFIYQRPSAKRMAFFFDLNLISKPRFNTGAKPLLTLIRQIINVSSTVN